MVGLCGTTRGSAFTPLTDPLFWTGTETRSDYEGEVSVVGSFYDPADAAQPARTSDGDADVWVWGEVWGSDTETGYEPRTGDVAGYCAMQYDRDGIGFVERLNGTFAVVVYDQSTRHLYLATDRFGTHPLFYAETTDGGLAFSTSVQSLPLHPAVETDFDVDSVLEYVTQGRVSGTYTPFTGVSELPPGSTMAVDIDTNARATVQYWRPVFRPREGPFSSFVTEFCDLFTQVLDERFASGDEDTTYGLLLSGGSDSRLLLAATERPLRTYHMADGMTREARTAHRVATTAGQSFRLLERDSAYQTKLLDENPAMMNFNGRFTQGHTTGFRDEVADEVDVVVTGLFSDCLFKRYMLPGRSLSLGPLGTLHLPLEAPTRTTEDFVARRACPAPAYLPDAKDLETVLRERLHEEDSAIVDHGVRYESLRELVSLVEYYPFSNDPDLFYWALTQSFTHWTPFLDNRLVDFALRYPTTYRCRHSLVDAAIARLSPELAAIPHAGSGVPVKYGFPVDFLWRNLTWLRRRATVQENPAAHEPWPPDRLLATGDPLLLRGLLAKRDLVEALPFLEWEGVLQTYCEHADGGNRLWELYALVSFLHMPAVEALARRPEAVEETLSPQAEMQETDRLEEMTGVDGSRRLEPEVAWAANGAAAGRTDGGTNE